ncbi:hypothetical protein GCM10025768_24790 [Microbacterium pseudoresistens]|uniref:Beta-N-acetylhexosaminidase n=1 Tax=Microbacterium pseudoresistens TaxID=640634 RepID=A0A7Y9JMY3_9MICO|nr:glycoside hydrolase family 3 N-terminal domain-containing protein [Microbacterium pseudoresistens]NYD55312.1 beta-N-acetylhexosaminidase [Microbacterium pseudoresistens]
MIRLMAVAAALSASMLLVGSAASSAPAAQAAHGTASVDVVAAAASSVAEAARDRVEAMTVREQAAAVVIGHIPSTDPAALAAYMDTGYGGFILMGSNVPDSEDELRGIAAAMTRDPSLPPLLAIDEEGGDVTRLPWDAAPAADTLKNAHPQAVEAAFAVRGSLVARGGISVNFGVIADVASGPGSFIYSRSMGTDAASAAERVAAAVRGEAPFVVSTLKHFPGHGAAEGDSHHMIPSTSMSLDDWRTSTAPPFVSGVDAGAQMLMFGHLAYTAVDPLPASLSSAWHEIARDELGFDGVIVTDDLGMLAATGSPEYADPGAVAVQALAAGNDLLLMVQGSDGSTAAAMVDALVAAVDGGALSAQRLQDAAVRVTAMRLQIGAAAPAWAPCLSCDPVG